MKSFFDDEGRWTHTFHQSWLSTASRCLEAARVDALDLVPRIDTDAACVGTALHEAAEVNIASGGLSLSDTMDVAFDKWAELQALDTFVWKKRSPEAAAKFLTHLVRLWWNEVAPTIEPEALTEWKFDVPLVEDDQRVIRLAGMADIVDSTHVRDYKSSGGGPYREYQYRRWGVQPSAYTYAANQAGLLEHAGFEFIVMHPKGVQRFEVERGPNEWAWLKERCVGFALMIESNLPTWPKQDDNDLCSERWCPAFMNGCKGSFVGNICA